MLSLLLLRHAKSSWDDSVLDDFDRPLNARGLKAAPLVGQWMMERNLSPGLIICSGARRTRETLGLILPFQRGDQDIHIEDGIYRADGTRDLLGRLHSIGKGPAQVLIIGHNPALQELILALSGSGNADDLAQIAVKYPTASLAEIQFAETDWARVSEGRGALVNFVMPRKIE